MKDTLAQLVKIDSVSSRSNIEIATYLESRCERKGFTVRRFPYTDEDGIAKVNLVAIAGVEFNDNALVELAIVGHTDTVPFDPNWEDALSLSERDGKLYGRGSCDTKAFIAAALTAVDALDLQNLRRPLALVFTADEEVGLLGAKHLAELRPISPRYSIVGEPTSLQPMRAGKGYCLAEVIVSGREAHSAYPSFGASAIFRAARLISRLESIVEQLKTEQHPGFDPAYTTVNVGLIRGGTAKNVIAGECRFTLEWRPIPGREPAHVLDLVAQAIDDEKRGDSDFECLVKPTRSDTGFETPADSALVRVLGTFGSRIEPVSLFPLNNSCAAVKYLRGPSAIFVVKLGFRQPTDRFVPSQGSTNTCYRKPLEDV